MNAVLWAWLLSLSGAALFFVAGSLSTLRRGAVHARRQQDQAGERDHELKALQAERDQLRSSVAELEQEALFNKARNSSRPPVLVDAGARGAALRDILDEETRGSGFTGAVITDGMGLIVASTGEYGDALAAYGAFLAGASAKTREALPLHDLRQVIVQDDHDSILTVRPISSADDNLALVTLAPGRLNGAGAGNLS
jgi:predicted regulator of Ras-like GTPase activity (Roadblock/LC7/MglB family)